MLSQVVDDVASVFLGRALSGIERQFGTFRLLVWIVDAGESLDFASTGFGIHPLHITLFADFQRGVDKNLDKSVGSDHVPNVVTSCSVGADCGADDRTPVPCQFSSNETDAANVDIPVILAESESF